MMVKLIGVFQLYLHAGVDEAALLQHLRGAVFDDPLALPLTRAVAGYQHAVMRRPGAPGHYGWTVTVDVLTEEPYDIDGQLGPAVRRALAGHAELTGVDTWRLLATA